MKGVVGYSRERGLIAVRLAKAEAVVKNPSWAAGNGVVIEVFASLGKTDLKSMVGQDM